MIRRSSSSTPSTCTSSDDRSGDRLAASGGALAGHRRQRLFQRLLSPLEERVEVVGRERTLGPRRQPVAPEHLVEDLAELGAHLLEVGGWCLVADADVRRPVDEAVIQDGVHRVPLPDAPQVGAREEVMVIDFARLDELGSERRAGVEVARALQQGQRNRGAVQALLPGGHRAPPLRVPLECPDRLLARPRR